jgi:WD40 repeat protein
VIGASNVASLLDTMEKVSTLLAIPEAPEDDFNFYHDRWMPDTCAWILSDSNFIHWMQNPISSQTLWINGPPGSGKSILSSFLINHFRTSGIDCNYYFFRFGDRSQPSAGCFLRSLAFQIAQQSPVYRKRLEELCDTGARLEKNDVKSLWEKLFLSVLGPLEKNSPIYIVVDGLDESDSPQTLMALLSSTPPSIPLRLVIVSRSTTVLSSAFEKFPESMPVTSISAESTGEDIPLFVEKELQSMHGSTLLRRKVMDEVIQRASGNFLWVHLALKEVLGCHTQDKIEQVLQDIPKGMHPLYQRMEEAMAESLEETDQELAKTLLAWVSCSQRPLSLDELCKALEPEFPTLIDLKYTIDQACGNFLVVDRKSRVTLVHQTAREYLTKISTGPFGVPPFEAQEKLFLRCISYLCDPHLRSQIGQSPSPVLLSYAARSWSFHLQARSAESEQVFAALSTFLQGSSVLIWIKTLATQNQLKILVQSSQALTAFAEKRRILDSSIALNLRPLQALEVIELWAIDLVKIVGKFGRNLIDTPDSIFKFVPQFCPHESAIHRQFGRKGAFSVYVSGDSHANWDDSLAKLFVGAESQALSVTCTGRYFAVLTTSNSIILWDSATCQEIRRLFHKEHVTALCASADGKKISSYGFRTTKVWDLSTGQELYSIPNPSDSRALSLAFAKNDTVIMAGSDDRIIRRVSLDNVMDGWKSVGPDIFREETTLAGTINSPCSLSFNPDGSQVAVAFRGAPLSIWGVDELRLVARCRRAREDQVNISARPWTPVDKVIWHPRSGEVLGIYQDGNVFKWHPLENSSQEINEATSAIACSPDGDIFATSDANGSVKIWKFYDFAPVYQLRCEYPVADLAFSPDNRRLYDLRGSFCNVWEPNALVRLSDLDKPGSEAASDSGSTVLSSTMSEAEADMMDPVTALAAGPSGNFYCTGNAEGVVKLLQSSGNKEMELWRSCNFMPIEHIAWSADGKHIALRDLGGKVIVKELEIQTLPGKGSQWSSRTIFDATVTANDGPIQQLLLSSTSDFLLITGPTSAQVWSIKSDSRIASWDSKSANAVFKWMNHPGHPDQLLAIGAESAFACSWQDLIEKSSVMFNIPDAHKSTESGGKSDQIRRPSGPRSMSSNDAGPVVENAMLTQDGAHVMVETTRFSGHHKSERQLMIFAKSAFNGTSCHLTPKHLPFPLLDKLQLPLGVLPGDKFIFLDNDHWLCCWQLSSSDGLSGIERHFFLPRDWLNAECLELCLVIDSGVLLIPKNGEVASIKSDLGLRW